jgi:hypothetical protein
MREVKLNGQKFEVRGLRLSEVSEKKMRKLGYGRFAFRPDVKDGDDQQERLAEIMDAALVPVLGVDGYAAVDRAGGVKGLQKAWRAIMAETYGTEDEEKNLSSAGSGSQAPSAETIATPAGEPPNAAPDASTGNRPS